MRIHDDEICYQVRGKFGQSIDEDQDDMEPDTRWVKLSSLVDNALDETDCQLLDTFKEPAGSSEGGTAAAA